MSRFALFLMFLCVLVSCNRSPPRVESFGGVRPTGHEETPRISQVVVEVNGKRADESNQVLKAVHGESLHVEGSYRLLPGTVPRLIGLQILDNSNGKEVVANMSTAKIEVDGDRVTFKGDIKAPQRPRRYLLRGSFEKAVIIDQPIDVTPAS